MTLKYFSGRVGGVSGRVGGLVGGVEKLILKLTSASTKVGVEVELSLAIYQELRNY